MSKKITIDILDDESIQDGIKELLRYKEWVLEKEKELRIRLAEYGAEVADIYFNDVAYAGNSNITVRVDDTGSVAVIYAEGQAVAFIEFGAGGLYGYGHPQASQFGFGPGTWSDGPEGKGHWNDPNGWYYAHGKHTYGNRPAMAMYRAVQYMLEDLTDIAKEVFGSK